MSASGRLLIWMTTNGMAKAFKRGWQKHFSYAHGSYNESEDKDGNGTVQNSEPIFEQNNGTYSVEFNKECLASRKWHRQTSQELDTRVPKVPMEWVPQITWLEAYLNVVVQLLDDATASERQRGRWKAIEVLMIWTRCDNLCKIVRRESLLADWSISWLFRRNQKLSGRYEAECEIKLLHLEEVLTTANEKFSGDSECEQNSGQQTIAALPNVWIARARNLVLATVNRPKPIF